MRTNRILITALTVMLLSCTEDEKIPEEEDKPTTYEYVYTGKHEIEDFTVYVGPKGEKIDTNSKLASNFWGIHSLLGSPYYDTILINRDSLFLKDEYSTIDFSLLLSKDTLKYKNNSTQYWGVFIDESTFRMNRAHYFINSKGRNIYDENGEIIDVQGGHYGYWRYHEKARMEEFFHENSNFKTLTDMNLTTDTIAWLTEYYEFKLTKKN